MFCKSSNKKISGLTLNLNNTLSDKNWRYEAPFGEIRLIYKILVLIAIGHLFNANPFEGGINKMSRAFLTNYIALSCKTQL